MEETSKQTARAGQILKHLKGAEIDVSIVLVQEEMTIETLTRLALGSILEFKKKVTEPAHLSVGKKIFAKGSVVSSRAYYGLQVEELIT